MSGKKTKLNSMASGWTEMNEGERKAYRLGKQNGAKSAAAGAPPKKRANGAKSKAKKPYAKNSKKGPAVFSHAGSFLGGMAGAALVPEGGPISEAIGSFLGGKIGHLADKIIGFGDYKVQSNSIMRGGMSAPQITNSIRNGGVVVRYREYLGDITSTTAFTTDVYYLNPGQRKGFPWLSTFAACWQQFRWRGLIFEFGSTSSDAVLSSATSSALGTVSMATDYDVLDTTYMTKREMLNTMFANSSKPSCTFIHPIECARKQTPIPIQYVRTGAYPSNADPRLYDLGKMVIATEGMQADGGAVGELWVTYEVEFFKQQLAATALSDNYALSNGSSALWLGIVAPTLVDGSTIGGICGTDGTNSYYQFPSWITNGKYLMTFDRQGTTAVLGQITPTVTHGSLFDIWESGITNFVQSPATGTNSPTIMCQLVVVITGASCRVTFGTAAVPTSSTGNLVVVQINYDSSAD
nr:putative capsid protein [Crucivirus sp.]